MRTRRVGWLVPLLLVFATTGCASSSRQSAGNTGSGFTEYDLQTPSPAAVDLVVTPSELRSGKLTVRTVPRDSTIRWSGAHVLLDRETDGRWRTVWALDVDGRSLPISNDVSFTAQGLGVPGELTLTVNPPPPPGRYRLRLGIASGPSGVETGGWPGATWATAMIEILP
jgi:hypothetical protein